MYTFIYIKIKCLEAMITLMKIVTLIFLSIWTDALGNEVFHRLEFSQYDSETLRNIKPTQQLLDDFLENNLKTFSNLEEPCKPEALNYNVEKIDISFNNLKITLENSSITAKSELSQQILRIKLTVRNIFLDGTSMIKSQSTNQRENFRFTSQNVVCSGIGGILLNTFDVDCEWVLLDCSQEHFTPLQVIFSNSLKGGKLNSGEMNLDIIESGLLSSIEIVLSSISSVKLKEALHLVDPTLKNLLHNVANMKFSRLETSDSNAFIDAAISVASSFIKEQYNDTVHLPAIKEAIPCTLFSLLHCETGLIAEHGIARHVSTLKRIGNGRITRRNVTIDFAGTLKFQKLNIYYDKYRVSVLGIGPTGKLRVLSEPVIFGIQLRINFGNRRITLIDFKLQKLGRTQILVSGLGVLIGKVLKRISTYIIGTFNAQVSRVIEKRVATYIKEALKKNTIDDILRGNLTV